MSDSLQRDGIQYLTGDRIEPSNWPRERVEGYAEAVRTLTELKLGEDLQRVVELFGGELVVHEYHELLKDTGSIAVHGPGSFTIVLPSYTSPLRDRFTIGHELGHYFLHSNQGEQPLCAARSGSSSRVEYEANWFSAALLMPEAQFREAAEELGNGPMLAAHFRVSEDAARVRGKVLGLWA